MTREDAINILKQYREKPTLINEIETVEEGVWLVEALDMAIKSLEQEPVLDKIQADVEQYQADCDLSCSDDSNCRTCNNITFGSIYRIINKYRGERNE